jgi:hypothetical protein
MPENRYNVRLTGKSLFCYYLALITGAFVGPGLRSTVERIGSWTAESAREPEQDIKREEWKCHKQVLGEEE